MPPFAALAPFEERVVSLPFLGVGISTEYHAGKNGLDLHALQQEHPDMVDFLEIGADLSRELDDSAWRWVRSKFPTTYHFLDLNLEGSETMDPDWIAETAALARRSGAAWLCGDSGLWHLEPRDRGHGVLLPPILVPESASIAARNVRHLRECSNFEVLPENPPSYAFCGPLHILDYFARVAQEADSGLLLDVAHLAIFQKVRAHPPLTGLDTFPLERVVEIHVAGGTLFEHQGRTYVEDDHSVTVLPETWEILDYVLSRTPNLRAVVIECERNRIEEVIGLFDRVRGAVRSARGSDLIVAKGAPQ